MRLSAALQSRLWFQKLPHQVIQVLRRRILHVRRRIFELRFNGLRIGLFDDDGSLRDGSGRSDL
ncbi:MAG TPA: hypothetical protein VKU82_15410 [Planctomycetaceae bacterium]|nr:hypothetical protein [Planctomycetaceae bacterium]